MVFSSAFGLAFINFSNEQITLTVKDSDYIVAVQEMKEQLAQTLYENEIKMPEQAILYKSEDTN
jgi:hypothetical protein